MQLAHLPFDEFCYSYRLFSARMASVGEAEAGSGGDQPAEE